MDSMIAKLRVALQLDSAAFESGTNRATQQVNALGINMSAARARMNAFSEGLIVSGNTAERMSGQLRAVNDNSGQLKAGMQNLGFQLQDIAVQFASGQRAGTIFAQQLPQVSGAISQIASATGKTTGVIGALASFMSGPWGVAVGVGAAVLSPLIAKLFETGKAADDAKAKVFGLKDALAGLKAAPMQTLGALNIEIVKAQAKLRQAEAMPRYTGGGSEDYKRNTYLEKARSKAIADAQLALQDAQSTYDVANQVYKNTQTLAAQAERIGASSGGSGGGGGSSARRAGQDAGREYRSGLEDELRKLSQTTNDLEATVFKPLADRSKEQLSFRDSAAAKFLQEQMADVSKVVGYTGEQIQNTNRRIGDSFVEMTDRTLSALQELSNGIRSGDFLSTLSGVIHLFGNLASTGLFGGKLASLFGSPNGRADGGPVSAGRMYMVGERGPELFLSKGPGTIVPNHNLRGSGGAPSSIQVVPSPYFDVVVDGRVIRAAPTIADAGGNLGFQRVARANSRRLA